MPGSQTPPAAAWFEQNPWKARLLVLLLCVAFVEGLTRSLVYAGLLPYVQYPTTRDAQPWTALDPDIGPWKQPNAVARASSWCFDVEISTNSVGARDRERRVAGTRQPRFVVLGDSYVEGVGMAPEQRFTGLLEHRTGLEFMNFGALGIGTVQEWMVYRSKAMAFEHSDVLLFLFPQNDFSDNDVTRRGGDVWLPFVRPVESGWELYYEGNRDWPSGPVRAQSRVIKNTIDNHVFFLNVLRGASRTVRYGMQIRATGFSDYDNYSPADFAVVRYVLEQLVADAGGRPVHVFLVPSLTDLANAMEFGVDFRLVRELRAVASAVPNLRVTDLSSSFLADARQRAGRLRDYVHDCDLHWNARGHEVVAAAVAAALDDRINPVH